MDMSQGVFYIIAAIDLTIIAACHLWGNFRG